MLSVFATEAELGEQKPIPVHALLPKELERFLSSLSADRKSTRLNSSHQIISYAVFCLKKKKILQFLKWLVAQPDKPLKPNLHTLARQLWRLPKTLNSPPNDCRPNRLSHTPIPQVNNLS